MRAKNTTMKGFQRNETFVATNKIMSVHKPSTPMLTKNIAGTWRAWIHNHNDRAHGSWPVIFNPHFGIHTGWCVLRPNGQQGPTPTTKPTLGTSLTIIWIAGIQHLATLDVVFRLIWAVDHAHGSRSVAFPPQARTHQCTNRSDSRPGNFDSRLVAAAAKLAWGLVSLDLRSEWLSASCLTMLPCTGLKNLCEIIYMSKWCFIFLTSPFSTTLTTFIYNYTL